MRPVEQPGPIESPGGTFGRWGARPTTTTEQGLDWLRERCAVDAAPAFTTPADPRHLLAVLLVDQARALLDLHAAVGRAASLLAGNAATIASATHHDILTHPEANEARQDARNGAVRLEGRLAAAKAVEDALGRLVAAWMFTVAARERADRCTHGADCTVHRASHGPHNYDPPWC